MTFKFSVSAHIGKKLLQMVHVCKRYTQHLYVMLKMELVRN